MSDIINDLKITNRLLALEAQSRGWDIEVFKSTFYSPQAILRAEKDKKEFFFSSTITALSPTCGFLIAEDKYLTYELLKSASIPIPEYVMIPGECNDFDEAYTFLKKHGRVVVKPTCTNHGDGITMDVSSKEQLVDAIDIARKATARSNSSAILVQEQVEGKEYRFLVVDGKCIAVANRRPAFVVGDGKKTIQALIEEKNKNPLRGEGHDKPLTKINIDDVVQTNGKDFLKLVPRYGQEIELLKTSNLSRGGEAVNCTDIASPELKKIAKDAAVRCQLGITGVDIITTDIRGGGKNYVIEVNSSPGIRMHVYPSVGESINVAKYIINALERHANPVARSPKRTIGRSGYVKSPLFGEGIKVPARIDTGARIASIWASNISMGKDGKLRFCLFDKQSEFYTGKLHEADKYKVSMVRNSTGQEEMRFCIKIPIVLAGKKILASFSLADRSSNSYPILIGRNVINKKFTVNVEQKSCQNKHEVSRMAVDKKNNEELAKDPYEFCKNHADIIVGLKRAG